MSLIVFSTRQSVIDVGLLSATYDDTGPVDYLATFDASGDQFENLTIAAGARVQKRLVDTSSRTGYSMIGVKPKTKQALASEYYQLDWESGELNWRSGSHMFLTFVELQREAQRSHHGLLHHGYDCICFHLLQHTQISARRTTLRICQNMVGLVTVIRCH